MQSTSVFAITSFQDVSDSCIACSAIKFCGPVANQPCFALLLLQADPDEGEQEGAKAFNALEQHLSA